MIPRKTGQETTLLESVPHGGIFMDNNYKGMAVGVLSLITWLPVLLLLMLLPKQPMSGSKVLSVTV